MQPPPPVLPNRLSSLDAFRGFVMFLMMAEVLHLAQVAKSLSDTAYAAQVVKDYDKDGDGLLGRDEAKNVPPLGKLPTTRDTVSIAERWEAVDIAPADDKVAANELAAYISKAAITHEPARDGGTMLAVWESLAFHKTHVEWAGCSLHDLIQPSFSFLVGAALPFSIFSRRQKGQALLRMLFHALWRAVLLVGLGVFLRSTHNAQTRFTFEDTLSQIGLGYFFLFLLGFARQWVQWVALVVILVGYWVAFWMYPAPGPDFDYKAVGVEENFLAKNPHYTGLAAHWNKNSNLAFAFDDAYVRKIPDILGHGEPFKPNRGGYATLSFIPTLGTMILGLIAGGWLKGEWSRAKKFLCLFGMGGISLAAGFLLDRYGICPSVKRIWTPSWVLVSGGWCLFFTAGFYALVDCVRLRPVFFPLIVIGMNSIAIYVLVHIDLHEFIQRSFRTHLGAQIFTKFGDPLQPFVAGAATLVVDWLILYWMYRNKVFVRI